MTTRRFGNYELVELLGRGGMGEVWRGRHLRLERPAAIKLIRRSALPTDAGAKSHHLLERFEREAQATSALKSPHTVELYDFGNTDDGTFYYAMELLEGVDLHVLVSHDGPLAAERVIYVLQQVCESLAEAHHAGLMHRDIKPANIFLCKLGLQHDFVKVLDFGLVKATGERRSPAGFALTTDGSAPGSPAFMPPEVIGGAPADARSDLYSLGCVAYWLLTGQLVFERETLFDLFSAHKSTAPRPPSERSELPIPAALEELVMRCLAKDPGDRPQNAQALASALRNVPVETPWTEERAAAWWQTHQPSRSWSRSPGPGDSASYEPQWTDAPQPGAGNARKWAAIGIGAVLALVAMAVGFTLWRPDPGTAGVATAAATVTPGPGTAVASAVTATGTSDLMSAAPPSTVRVGTARFGKDATARAELTTRSGTATPAPVRGKRDTAAARTSSARAKASAATTAAPAATATMAPASAAPTTAEAFFAAPTLTTAELAAEARTLAARMGAPVDMQNLLLRRLRDNLASADFRKTYGSSPINGVFVFHVGGGGFVLKVTKGTGRVSIKGGLTSAKIVIKSSSVGAILGGSKTWAVGLVMGMSAGSTFGGLYKGSAKGGTFGDTSIGLMELSRAEVTSARDFHRLYIVSAGSGASASAGSAKLRITVMK